MSKWQAPAPGVVPESIEPIDETIRGWAETLGIATLTEWDVLSFLYRHGTSLISSEQIARLIGYGTGQVGEALDRLERGRLIERSRPSRGVRLYKFSAAGDSRLERSFLPLLRLTKERAGRLLLMKILQAPPRGAETRVPGTARILRKPGGQ
jgi:DNA-binding PadR family transcriptional regulator